ncbi:MAG: hypothetical protein FWG34_07460, partial [Oscillospiraceae bacterium]|nr:hypothetical protein [Oscillospiraceae bacterium]
SNMIPAKLTGKPFWDIYLYQDPPLWRAYIDCVKYFGFDSLYDTFIPIDIGDPEPQKPKADIPETKTAIVFKSEKRLVTQNFTYANGKQNWAEKINVYYSNNPPNWGVDPHAVRLPKEPDKFELLDAENIKRWPSGEQLLKLLKSELGDHGLVGAYCGTSSLIGGERDLYDYMDDPKKYHDRRDWLLDHYEKVFMKILSFSCKPDFIAVGASGTLINQTPQMFAELGLPIVKKMTALAKKHGFPSHIHSCGREAELVKICAEETDLTVIDPLEVPPMGDCDLKELKRLYGDRLVLKGNLHTTKVMLHGSAGEVADASKKAIDDAAAGGRFILSTGDQCGRDTPFENIAAMIETAKTYGRY